MNTFRTNSSLLRVTGLRILGALVLGGTFATAAAFSGRGSSGDEDPASPAPEPRPGGHASAASGPYARPRCDAGAARGRPSRGTRARGDPGAEARGDPGAEAVATPEPTDDGDDAMPITVDLETADGHDVHVDIVDRYGLLESAVFGHPAEGMSVEPFKLEIENLDERTLKLTWVDFGIDNALALHFFQEGRVLVLVQPDPAGDVDATGHDRELILTFEEPISAEDIEGFLQTP